MDRRIFFQYPSHDDKGRPCRRTYAVRVHGLDASPPSDLAEDATQTQRDAHEEAAQAFLAAEHEHRTRSHRAHLDVANMRRLKGGGAILEEDADPLPATDPPPPVMSEVLTAPAADAPAADHEAHAETANAAGDRHAAAVDAHAKTLVGLAAARKADNATFAAPTEEEHKRAALVDFARHAMGNDASAVKLWEENLRGMRREAFAKQGRHWVDPAELAKTVS